MTTIPDMTPEEFFEMLEMVDTFPCNDGEIFASKFSSMRKLYDRLVKTCQGHYDPATVNSSKGRPGPYTAKSWTIWIVEGLISVGKLERPAATDWFLVGSLDIIHPNPFKEPQS